jgi:hypothetical protein
MCKSEIAGIKLQTQRLDEIEVAIERDLQTFVGDRSGQAQRARWLLIRYRPRRMMKSPQFLSVM